jgi:hypothetical protein
VANYKDSTSNNDNTTINQDKRKDRTKKNVERKLNKKGKSRN